MTIKTDNWKTYEFGDLAHNLTVAVKDPLSEGYERYVGLEHVEPGNMHIKSWGNVADGTTFTRLFKKGQVLFGKRRAYQRKAALAAFEGVCSGDILVFEANEDNVIPELLPFIVQSDKLFDYAIKTSAGSLSPRTKFKDLAKLKFKLPTLPEQNHLADLLWSVDEVIEKYVNVTKELSLLYAVELKILSGLKGDIGKIDDIACLHYGDGLKESDRKEGHYPVVGSSGIVGMHCECKVNGPGIVIGRKGSAGEVVWIKDNFWPIDTTYWVELKNNRVSLEFFFYLLKSLDLPALTITTAVPGLNRDDVLIKRIKIPERPIQKQVVGRFKSIQSITDCLNKQITNSKSIQKQLINQIFR